MKEISNITDGHALSVSPAAPPIDTQHCVVSGFMSGIYQLTALERELLELCSNAFWCGEASTVLDQEMLEHSPGRAAVEATLKNLLERGLLSTERARYAGHLGVFEDDWWVVTAAGRAAIGVQAKPLSQ